MPSRNPLHPGTLSLVGFCIAMSVSGQLLLRHGMLGVGPLPAVELLQRAVASPWVLAGLAAYLLGTVVWLVVLSRLDLSVAYALGASNFVLITLLSAVLLHEHVSALRWAGTMLILGGIIVVARGERRRLPPNPTGSAVPGGATEGPP